MGLGGRTRNSVENFCENFQSLIESIASRNNYKKEVLYYLRTFLHKKYFLKRSRSQMMNAARICTA